MEDTKCQKTRSDEDVMKKKKLIRLKNLLNRSEMTILSKAY